MGERLRILWSRFWPDVHVAGDRIPPFDEMTHIVAAFTEPPSGWFRIAIHHPDGSAVDCVAAKGRVRDIVGNACDSYSVLDAPNEPLPKGSLLEVLGPCESPQAQG